MQSAFVLLLRSLIERRFNGVDRQFIIATKPKSVPAATAYLSQVLRDAKPKPPPMDSLAAWADALELYGDERQNFMDLAAVAHLPAEVQPRFVGMIRKLKAAESQLDAINSRLDALERQGKRVAEND